MCSNFSLKQKEPLVEIFCLAGFLALFLFVNDRLIALRPLLPSQIWAIYDCAVHGLVGVLVLYPIYKTRGIRFFPVLFLLSAVIDVDHFIAAKSLYLGDALRLPLRPVTHSVTHAILLAAAGFLLTRNKIASWTLFAALSSHVIRDASAGGTAIFWPLAIYCIPTWLYYGAEIALLYFSFLISDLGVDKNYGKVNLPTYCGGLHREQAL